MNKIESRNFHLNSESSDELNSFRDLLFYGMINIQVRGEAFNFGILNDNRRIQLNNLKQPTKRFAHKLISFHFRFFSV